MVTSTDLILPSLICTHAHELLAASKFVATFDETNVGMQ